MGANPLCGADTSPPFDKLRPGLTPFLAREGERPPSQQRGEIAGEVGGEGGLLHALVLGQAPEFLGRRHPTSVHCPRHFSYVYAALGVYCDAVGRVKFTGSASFEGGAEARDQISFEIIYAYAVPLIWGRLQP